MRTYLGDRREEKPPPPKSENHEVYGLDLRTLPGSRSKQIQSLGEVRVSPRMSFLLAGGGAAEKREHAAQAHAEIEAFSAGVQAGVPPRRNPPENR